MIWLFFAVVLAIEALLVVATGYLVLLVVASLLPKRPSHRDIEPRRRFAILVPAHDEEQVIGRLLDSLGRLDYPRELFDVHVVADNCDDRTAQIARDHDAQVHERRSSPSDRGKGQALRWLLDRLSDQPYDAYVVFDADSVVSPGFLRVVDARLEEGWTAVQGYYGVLNPDDSWVAGLRSLAFSLLQFTRRRGLAALGASAGLAGNGMAFARELRQVREWNAFGLTEDLELHLKLVERGIKVAFAPEAVVLAEMPTSLAQAKSQNVRWERGRLGLARAYGPRLLAAGLARRDRARLVAAIDVMVPPQSILVLLALAMLAASFALGSSVAVALAGAVLVGQVAYTVGGLARARVPLRRWSVLAWAPAYALWKAWVYLRALSAGRALAWVRTARVLSEAGATGSPGRDEVAMGTSLDKTDR